MATSTTSYMNLQLYVSMTLLVLKLLLPNNAPSPHLVTNTSRDDITQEVLEKCFLPFPASTSSTDENAKVSILVESCFRLYLRNSRCWHTPDLDEAIEKGIVARENKIKGEKKPRDPGARKRQEMAREWLKASGERLRSLLAFVEVKTANDWNSDSD
jgi:hypothetical protein